MKAFLKALKPFLNLVVIAVFFWVLARYGKIVESPAEWFMNRLFVNAGWFCMLSVALIAYPISIVAGWKDRKMDISDGK